MSDPKNQNPTPDVMPIDGQNAGIHLAYLRRDFDTFQKSQEQNFKEIKETLEKVQQGVPSRNEFEDMKREVDKKSDILDFTKLESYVKDNLVTKTDFEPIKKFVYGMVALTLVAVATAVLALVIKT